VTLASLACALVGGVAAIPANAQEPVVTIDDGQVRGARVEGVEAFRGIRYAAPPVGSLRFAPPEPVAPWSRPLNATRRSRACAQLASSNGPQVLNEDCLSLDVWRPRQRGDEPASDLPVLVFIHGGGNTNGSAGQQRPSRMVREADTIVVNINYRLGILGWLAHPSLDQEPGDASGNLGLLDQQAALRWVRENIERFGGDPTNVTVAGESAGAWGVCAHLASPGSAELFHRAIIASINCDFREEEAALEQGAGIATSLGCTDPATAAMCLRGKSTLALMNAWQGDARPVVRGEALPLAPVEAFEAGDYNRVPVIFGNTYDEFSFFLLGNPDMTQAELRAGVAQFYPDQVEEILAEYAGARSPAWGFSAAMNDPFICGMNDQAALLSESTLVWYYEFNDQDPPPEVGIDLNLGAYHSGELQYLYGFLDRSDGTRKQSRRLDASERRLSGEMIGYWGAFAAKGNPNHRGALHWPRFDPDESRVMRFQPGGSEVVDSFDDDHHCGFWRDLGVPLGLPAPLGL
jgi:para-nitrobenzyl esterase